MSCFIRLISEHKYTRYSVTKTILLNSVDLVSFILLCIYLLHIDNYENVLGILGNCIQVHVKCTCNVQQYI